MKTQQTTEVIGKVPKHIFLLCALLFTGCMDDDFFTPEDGDYTYDNRYPYDGVKERFNQRSVHYPRHNRREYPYDLNPPFRSWSPNYEVYNNTGGWQDNYHSWGNDYTKPLRTASKTQPTRNRPYGMSQEVFEQGCTICAEENAYKDHKAIKCFQCNHFVCQPCYRNIREASNTPIRYDYRVPMGTCDYRLKKECPFCREHF